MANARRNQLTRQVGEHLVVAELGRRGLLATPFAGNVPDFDVLAMDEKGKTVPIQVKSIRGPSWQFNTDKFLEIEMEDKTQYVKGKKELDHPELICVFVLLKGKLDKKDRFFILRLKELQDYFKNNYGPVLNRPRNPYSFHCAIGPKDIEHFEDNWDLIIGEFE